MKSVEAFVEEIEGSAALREELAAVSDPGSVAELLRRHGVAGTAEDLARAIQARSADEGEIPDDDVEAVAGGGASFFSAVFWEGIGGWMTGKY